MCASINRREQFECKAHGAQRPRRIMKIGEKASTVQRRNRTAQQIGEVH